MNSLEQAFKNAWKICGRCQGAIDRDVVEEIIRDESPADWEYDRPMESYTENEQALRLGLICSGCYEKEQ
jgi:hypothetical protein